MGNRTVFFVVSVAGMAVSASVLILLVPALSRSLEPGTVRAAGVAAFLAVVFAVGSRRWGPPESGS